MRFSRKAFPGFLTILIILAIAGSMVVLPGCDDDDDDNTTTPAGSAPPASSPSEDEGKSYTLRMAHGEVATAIGGVAAEEFARLVDTHTNGRVEIELYPNSMLYGLRELEQATQTGANDILWFSTFFLSSNIPYLKLGFQAGYWDGPEHCIAFNTHPDFTAQLSADMAPDGLHLLGVPLVGMQTGFFSSKRVEGAQTLQDYDGLRYGVRAGSATTIIQKWAGLTAVEVNPTELLTSFQTGVFDVYGAQVASGASTNVWDMGAKQCIVVPSGGNFNFALAVNSEKWDELPSSLQDIITNTVVPEFIDYCHQQREALETDAIAVLGEHMDVVVQPLESNAEIWALAADDSTAQKIIEDAGALYDLAESLR